MRTLRNGMVGLLALTLGLGVAHYARGEALGLDIGVLGSYVDGDDLGEAYGAGAKIKLNLTEVIGLDVTGSYLEFDDTDVEMIPVEGTVLLQIPLGDSLKL